jgi:hypothetical protein
MLGRTIQIVSAFMGILIGNRVPHWAGLEAWPMYQAATTFQTSDGKGSGQLEANGNGQPATLLNVRAFGAMGDGQVATDCSMRSGTAVLTCATQHFSRSDVGKVIAVYGAGSTIRGFIQPLATIILSYQSPEIVVLKAAASTTVTNSERVVWGTDCTAAIQSAVDEGIATRKGRTTQVSIYFPSGIYLSNVIDLPCSEIGKFSAGQCVMQYNNVWLRGSGRDVTTIENWNPVYDYVGQGHTYQGGSGVVVYGGKGATPGSDGINGRLKSLTISDVTIRQVKNPTQAAAKVVFGATSEDAHIYNTRMIGYSYECLVLGGGENSWHDSVHDNLFESCGNTGPGQPTSVAAINVNGSHTEVYNNVVTGSPQGTETGGRNQLFRNNLFDGTGTSATPNECINIGSTGAGVWGNVFRKNTCRNFVQAVVMGNSGGTLDRLQFQENTFIDSGSAELAGGADFNSLTRGMTELDTVIHGTSTFEGNTFLATKVNISKCYGIQIGYGGGYPQLAQESWEIDQNTIEMPDISADSIGIAIHLVSYSFFAWQPSTAYTTAFGSTTYVQPTVPNGYYYKAIVAGKSGRSEPDWCRNAGCTIADGEVKWILAGPKPRVTIANNKIHIKPGVASRMSDITWDGTRRDDITFVNDMFSYGWRQYSRTPVPGYPDVVTNPEERANAGVSYGDNERYLQSLPTSGFYKLGGRIHTRGRLSGNTDWIVTRSGYAAPEWAGSTVYSFNSWVTAVPQNGHFYRQIGERTCTSGQVLPEFPVERGASIIDATCIWKESGDSAQFTPLKMATNNSESKGE